jgi:hypothetical protein
MTRFAGTENAELFVVVKLIWAPVCGAGPFKVAVTVADDPLVMADGLIVTLVKVGPDVVKLDTVDQFPY